MLNKLKLNKDIIIKTILTILSIPIIGMSINIILRFGREVGTFIRKIVMLTGC